MVSLNDRTKFWTLFIQKFWTALKIGGLPTRGKSIFDALSPKWVDKYVFDRECCLLISTQLPSSVVW